MDDSQTRTLDLGAGRRTTLRFDAATWRAIELIAAAEGIRWTQWARNQMQANAGTINMHAAIRAAVTDSLLASSVVAERAELLTGGTLSPALLQGCAALSDQQLDEELRDGLVEGEPLDFVGFELLAGVDRNGTPTLWVRNNLRGALHAALALPFTAVEVEERRGTFA